MAVALGKYLNFKVKGNQYLQDYNFGLDYRLMDNTDIPIEEICSDIKSHFMSWIATWLVDDLVFQDFELKVYDHLTYTPATNTASEKLKIWYGESHVIPGGASDHGGSSEEALPTYVTVTGRKIASGLPTKFQLGGTTVLATGKDTKFAGRIATSGLQENFTQDGQGNMLATTVGANWLGTWQSAFSAMVRPWFRNGTVGGRYSLQMQVRSDKGPGNRVRKDGDNAYIVFCPVSSVAVQQLLGSQMTRKQRKRNQ